LKEGERMRELERIQTQREKRKQKKGRQVEKKQCTNTKLKNKGLGGCEKRINVVKGERIVNTNGAHFLLSKKDVA
jgi:hypothetical protein